MKEEKYKCPLCEISHNLSNDYQNKNNYNDEKLLCSTCINTLLSKDNNLVFPHDFIDYSSIKQMDEIKNENDKNNEIKHQSINKSIIEEIQQQSKNKVLIEEMKQQVNNNKSLINGKKNKQSIPNTKNNSKNNSKNKNKKFYIKKTVKVNKLPEYENREIYNSHICNLHSLPLNVICIDEKQRICSQCSLSKKHLNHKITTEKDLNQNIKELSNIYNDIENNQSLYKHNINNNKFSVIEDIHKLFLETENNLTELKNKIINNINNQFSIILNFINLRRKEIFEKYQNNNYDLSNLNESSHNWMKVVSVKFDESNIKNNNKNIDIIKLINKNDNNDIFDLISTGKQLTKRYNFIKDINQIINNLELYRSQGITIKQNEYIINSIKNPDNKIIFIDEDQDLVKSLNLSPYNHLMKEIEIEQSKNKQNNNIDIYNNQNEYDNNKNIYNKENYIYLKNKIIDFGDNNNQKQAIYHRKFLGDIDKYNFTESDFYKEKTNRNIYKNQSNIYDNTATKTNTKRNTLSYRKKTKQDFNKISNFIYFNNINNTEFTETKSPLYNNINNINNLDNINKINSKFTKLLRNNTTGCITSLKIQKNKNKIKNESVEVSNYNDNNININFNGHIFNYNSDSNFSINLQDINNSKKNENDTDNNNINDIFDLLTPKKNEIEIKKIENNEKQKIMRCFSFNGENNKKKMNIKKKSLNSISTKNIHSLNNTNNNILYSNINIKRIDEQTYRNMDYFGKTTDKIINNKSSKKIKYNYKTLSNKELDKYVNYQLKKLKPNFNRINLRDNGIKIICSFFKKNKNKKYKELKLQGCNINDNDFDLLKKSLIENNVIIPIINLSENKLTDDCAFFIIDFINEYNEIKNISFTNNLFSKGIKEKIKEIVKIKKNQDEDFNIQI